MKTLRLPGGAVLLLCGAVMHAAPPIAQAVMVLEHDEENRLGSARKFMDFLFTPKARAIFEKYGYVLP